MPSRFTGEETLRTNLVPRGCKGGGQFLVAPQKQRTKALRPPPFVGYSLPSHTFWTGTGDSLFDVPQSSQMGPVSRQLSSSDMGEHPMETDVPLDPNYPVIPRDRIPFVRANTTKEPRRVDFDRSDGSAAH